MLTFSSIEAAVSSGALRGTAVCLGNFDGVHLGHQALLLAARQLGKVAVLTFEPHPGKVLQPQLAPLLLTTPKRKLELLEASGVDTSVVHPFTKDFAATAPEAFEAVLFDALGVRAVVVGSDFTYGRARGGSVHTLHEAARRRASGVECVSSVTVDGVVVSSSRIREYVLEGRVEAAARLLGRPFDLDGRVVAGAQRGRTLGFPTANVETLNEVRPAAGVYAIRTALESGAVQGGVCNIGVKPTFGASEVTLECHLLDFDQDLYGSTLRVQFLERLRNERRFAGPNELKMQIAQDVDQARAILKRNL